MNNWWKSPVLQGEENDYGDYDYLATELPQNTVEWTRWEQHCDSCGKNRNLHRVSTSYFYTLDGYDSMSYYECWICVVKDAIRKPFRKLKKKIKIIRVAMEFKHDLHKKSWKHCYKLAKELTR